MLFSSKAPNIMPRFPANSCKLIMILNDKVQM